MEASSQDIEVIFLDFKEKQSVPVRSTANRIESIQELYQDSRIFSSHDKTLPGTYSKLLKIRFSPGLVSEAKSDFSLVRPPMCSPRDGIEGKEAPKSFLVPNEVKLVAVP